MPPSQEHQQSEYGFLDFETLHPASPIDGRDQREVRKKDEQLERSGRTDEWDESAKCLSTLHIQVEDRPARITGHKERIVPVEAKRIPEDFSGAVRLIVVKRMI